MDKIVITGSCGFIGFHVSKRLLDLGYDIVGLDNLNQYYDLQLKLDRNYILQEYSNYYFYKIDINDYDSIEQIFKTHQPTMIINLAAQAGVRFSLTNRREYLNSNINGFFNLTELALKYKIKKFLYASSSSVYGNNLNLPFKETDRVDNFKSFYAMTKITNELMAKNYSDLFDINFIGLRFFTVYGPYGRPDMAYFSFVDKYFKNIPIEIYNDGNFKEDLFRDFTYIDDVVESIIEIINSNISFISKHEIYNIGCGSPVKLMDFISLHENSLSKLLNKSITFKKIYINNSNADVKGTYSTNSKFHKAYNNKNFTNLEVGLDKFNKWYLEYNKIGVKWKIHEK